ncbi:hypothetical protein GOP47_0000467 [Adiantum capillus-veneris]|uniref:Uncharacterized protein n=1 Tax=Adiantum capillus-veneris TaxID=13818 RepID=A0A9D4VDK5_ADICA|nr:hypothetical protein GOP47_0000467 [Adiantum capillus-veneris]
MDCLDKEDRDVEKLLQEFVAVSEEPFTAITLILNGQERTYNHNTEHFDWTMPTQIDTRIDKSKDYKICPPSKTSSNSHCFVFYWNKVRRPTNDAPPYQSTLPETKIIESFNKELDPKGLIDLMCKLFLDEVGKSPQISPVEEQRLLALHLQNW